MEKSADIKEHILVCLSASPSNAKIIEVAAKMAAAFDAAFTAIYVRTPDFEEMPQDDLLRLNKNIELAKSKGASVTTVIGENIPLQIAEYARVSGITKIVIGRSSVAKRHFLGKPALTEQLITEAPYIDIYIIPDSSADLKLMSSSVAKLRKIRLSGRDILITVLLLAAFTLTGLLFSHVGFSESTIVTVYILGVLINSTLTSSAFSGIISSLLSVLLFNYFFVTPKFSLYTIEADYAITFAVMLTVSLITSTLTTKLKANARQSAQAAFRTKVLFDTNQLLQKARTEDEVIEMAAGQINILLSRSLIIYRVEKDSLGTGRVFGKSDSADTDFFFDEEEIETAKWVLGNQRKAGATTDVKSFAKGLYLAIRINGSVYGVLGIDLEKKPLETFEYSVLMSIIGECALAMENLKNQEEKEKAALMAENEKLRSNILRTISHDLRTPLTSISGNASNLLNHYGQLDEETRTQIFSDIFDDSEWLINLVENLLSVTRLENGQMELHMSSQPLSDVIEEAVKHLSRDSSKHKIYVKQSSDLLFARMDSKLIVQVIINLINNAIKYTPSGSHIEIRSEKAGNMARVSVSDDGPGIHGEARDHVFEMFYTGKNDVADSRRSMGLGLALCKSIIEAHGGSIEESDNSPSGCVFTFELPLEEVKIDE